MDDGIVGFIKQIIATRGAQLLTRYVGTLLAMLATWAGVAPDGDNHTAVFITSILVALLCKVVDLVSHAIQKDKLLIEKEMAEGERNVAEQMLKNRGIQPPLIVFMLLIPFLTGCKTAEQVGVGIGTALSGAATHIHPTITYSAETGTITGGIEWREIERGANGERQFVQVTRATVAEVKQCRACCDVAEKALKDSYRGTIAEINATQKRELNALKVRRLHCGIVPIQEVQTPVYQPTIPSAGEGLPSDDFTIPGRK